MTTAIACIAADASAVDFESLVSPGPLIEAHAREVEECGECHESFDRGSQKRLCLACHEAVAADVERAEGLHGRLAAAGGNECRVCHTEHIGADADILGFAPESFDHQRTDFPLEGGHAAVSCAGCHVRGAAYREAQHDCVACHGESDPHEGRLGEACADCHTPRRWTAVEFDHSTTHFALEGGHTETSCASCHPSGRFEALETDCITCHRVDDAHRGRLGPRCDECHDTASWKRSRFDHGRKTGFALRGAHAPLDCRSCHTEEPGERELPETCVGCHRLDDAHRGARGDACADCHGERSWSAVRFDHTRDARFELHGAHADLACELCHTGVPSEAETPTRCIDCHELADVHRGTLGADCARCHAANSWGSELSFDHDFTDFPLLALHQLASCEDCHVSRVYADTEPDCAHCHARDDAHERRLGSDCERCHNPNGWRHAFFEHEAETGFALLGGHADLLCVQCHVKPTSGASRSLHASSRCDACHLADSPHDDAYGRDCERCHVVESWERTTQGVR